MMKDRRARAEELLKELQLRRASYEVTTLIELLTLRLEEAKDALMVSSDGEFRRVQGEAATYDRLLKQLKRQAIKPDGMKATTSTLWSEA